MGASQSARSMIFPMAALLHDDTFRRLCRGRDMLAAEYRTRVLLQHAAREACLSEYHFHRLFRTTFGETPHEFLTRLRMDCARQMLASEHRVTDVCFELGYESVGSFSTKFRACHGRSPVEFQRQVRRVFGYSAPWKVLMVPECFLQALAIN